MNRTSQPATVTTNWRTALPVLAGSTFTLRELGLEDAASLHRDADHRRSGAIHFAAADHG